MPITFYLSPIIKSQIFDLSSDRMLQKTHLSFCKLDAFLCSLAMLMNSAVYRVDHRRLVKLNTQEHLLI